MTNGFDPRAVNDPAHVRLLSSPVRQELVDTMAAIGGEADVATLSEQLGRPADGLYYHLRALVAGGLLEETRAIDGSERRYRLAGEGVAPLRLTYDLSADGNAAELRAFARGLLQIAGRDFENALASEGVVVAGAGRELWASRNKGWLSSDDLAELNTLLERLSALTSQTKTADRDRLASLAFVLAPINALPKRRVLRDVGMTKKRS
jgi:DNA-binding transcriptional ArsR family regulator